MEQNNQQVTQKPTLPIKTKIAATINILIGIGIIWLGGIFFLTAGLYGLGIILAILTICIGVLVFISGPLLFRIKTIGWWLGVIDLLPVLILGLYYIIIGHGDEPIGVVIVFLSSIPLILLLLDRKNFWKIAS
jgi:hypothetical protein